MAAVCGADHVAGCGGAGDRRAEVTVRVAAQPLVGESARELAPGTGCDLERPARPAAATGPTRSAYCVVVPALSVARTTKPSVWPTSAATSVYVGFVAPWIERQWAPAVSQRNQL